MAGTFWRNKIFLLRMIEIRDIVESDFEACAGISVSSLPGEAWKIQDFEAASKNSQAMLLTAWYNRETNRMDAVVNQSETDAKSYEIAGYLVSYFAADEAELNSIAVSEKFRRCGIGRSLMQEYYRNLIENKVASIYLEVRQSNKGAISFYENEGFVRFSKRPRFYENPAEDAVLMRKSL